MQGIRSHKKAISGLHANGFAGMVLAVCVTSSGFAQQPSALQILDQADDKWDLNLKNTQVELELLVYRENELRKTYRMVLKYQDTDHVLAETIFPPRNKGEKMLQAGRRNYWIFLPNINRSMRISESNSLSNSDFSNTDLLSPRLSKEYTPRILGTEKLAEIETYKLELLAKDESTPYAKIIYWIRKADNFPLRRDYYTFSQQLLKRLDMKSSSPGVNGIPADMPDTFVMSSVLERDKKTVIRYFKHGTVPGFPAETFLPSALMKR
ncbi:MAG: outer membrane lipoprotein-sorting protein [Gammaproteobacteria bacterium]|nr:outer membrane lipoprotein-sorting protein [Gammaproteobacteria bacterium]